MEQVFLREMQTSFTVQSHLHNEFPLQSKEEISKLKRVKPDAGLLASMVEHDLMPFHQRSGNDVKIIYDLSQEVYYRHHQRNPELAKLAASLFLFFSDFGYYLNIEQQRLIPLVRDLVEKVNNSDTGMHAGGQSLKELKIKIQREHYFIIDKLKYFRILTGDYRKPEGGSRSYKLLFDKLRKLENDLVLYIHFETDRFFPLAIEMEKYLFCLQQQK